MDPLFGRTSSQLGKPSSPTSHPKDFISIRALSYQKFVPETKLQEDFFRTTHCGFVVKPTLNQYKHKLSKNINSLASTVSGSQIASMRMINTVKNESRLRNKTSFNFDSINYNKLIKKSNAPAFFTKFMTGKSPSALLHPPYEIPDEKKIEEDYRFKLPVIISNMENENIYINVLMAFPHSNDFIQNYIDDVRKRGKQLEDEKQSLKTELDGMNKKFSDELSEQMDFFKKEFEKLQLKDDFVKNQNENFRLQKEITLMLRDKTMMELDIESALERIKGLELQIYKVEMYDLKINEEYINTISTRNLRPEHTDFLQTTHFFH